MLVFRSAALLIALIVISAPGTAVGQAQSQPAAIAPEHQDMAARRAKEREKINNCQKQATEQKILPRDRPQFVINCLDGTAERNQPSVIAPEHQELAAKRAKEKERVDVVKSRQPSKKSCRGIGRNS
jgi:cell division septation protein DedD